MESSVRRVTSVLDSATRYSDARYVKKRELTTSEIIVEMGNVSGPFVCSSYGRLCRYIPCNWKLSYQDDAATSFCALFNLPPWSFILLSPSCAKIRKYYAATTLCALSLARGRNCARRRKTISTWRYFSSTLRRSILLSVKSRQASWSQRVQRLDSRAKNHVWHHKKDDAWCEMRDVTAIFTMWEPHDDDNQNALTMAGIFNFICNHLLEYETWYDILKQGHLVHT